MASHRFKTVEEALEYFFSEEIEDELTAIPPEVDELTDEEDVDDDSLTIPVVSDIAGTTEVTCHSDQAAGPSKSVYVTRNHSSSSSESELDDVQPSTSSNTPPKKCARQEENIRWEKTVPLYTKLAPLENDASTSLENMKVVLENFTPVQLFEEMFTEETFQLIVRESVRYASEGKNNPNFNLSTDNIRAFVGFLIFSGYHKLPSERDYWSDEPDLGVQLVRDAMSRKSYLELKSYIHFQDNSKANECKQELSAHRNCHIFFGFPSGIVST